MSGRFFWGVIVMCVFGTVAFGQPWAGGGVEYDPYLIFDANDMQAIGADANYWDVHFQLMADINLGGYTGTAFNIIGNESNPFAGVFDGNGHSISNFNYTSTGTDNVGLFGFAAGMECQIKDITLIDPNVDGGTGDSVGALVGCMNWSTTISNCHVLGGSVSGENNVGGLVGVVRDGVMLHCSSTARVSGIEVVGGLVGFYEIGHKMSQCYAGGNVSGNSSVGGLIGYCLSGEISNCYAYGAVSGGSAIGGLVGAMDGIIYHCYSVGNVSGTGADVGGLVGWSFDYGLATSCFWDKQASGQAESCLGIGKTTAEMKDPNTYIGWGCESAWTIDAGVDYPRLWWQEMPGEPIINPPYSGGSGTEGDPYLIYNAEELNRIGLIPCDFNKHFKLMADINMADFGGPNFNVIGNVFYPFTGVFDGNSHRIWNLMCLSTGENVNAGLFGSTDNGQIKDLGLINPYIDAGTNSNAGSLIGDLMGGTLLRCYATGGSISGYYSVGGLVGSNEGRIVNCYAMIATSGNRYVGGLVGRNQDVIVHCYSTGEVYGGLNTGGLVGRNLNLVDDSFWDVNSSGQSSSSGGTGKTTAEMQVASTFTDWGCDLVWVLDENNDYPRLLWENQPGQVITTKGKFGGGCGTSEDPYLIYTHEQMDSIGTHRECWENHFKLKADIDLGGYPAGDFHIIGYYNDLSDDKPFRGVFDGDGHKIFNFSYTSTGLNHVGLFGYINGSGVRILNLGLITPNVDAEQGYYVGSLVGWQKGGIISGCYAKGGSVSGHYNVGGLVGRKGANMNNCYASVDTSGTGGVGGLTGVNYGSVSNCYSTGRVQATSGAGGLIGSDLNLGSTINSFWDIETSEQLISDGGTGKTTEDMQTQSTFTNAGWDFVGEVINGPNDVWRMCVDGMDYPKLWWEFVTGDFVCPDGVDFTDFAVFAMTWLLEDGEAGYNPICDISVSADETIDILDLYIFTENWLTGK